MYKFRQFLLLKIFGNIFWGIKFRADFSTGKINGMATYTIISEQHKTVIDPYIDISSRGGSAKISFSRL
jgi:hypothetical protein